MSETLNDPVELSLVSVPAPKKQSPKKRVSVTEEVNSTVAVEAEVPKDA